MRPLPFLSFVATFLLVIGCVSVDSGPEETSLPVRQMTATPRPPSAAGGALLRPVSPTPAPTPAATPVPGCLTARPEATPSVNGTPVVNTGQRVVAPRLEVVGEPFRASPAIADPRLEQVVREALGDAADSYGVFVKDLETGRSASINADRPFFSASVYKLFVLYELFRQEREGHLSLDEMLVLTPHYDSFAFGPRATRVCERMSVRDLARSMMSVSDNAAGVLLLDVVGSWNLNAALEAFGLPTFRVLEDDLPLTAIDAALMLEAVVRGEAVDRAASEAMLALLTTERFDNGIIAGLPAGTVVAHKTGNLPNATNQAAIVYSPKATYILVVLTERGYETRYIRAVSEAVYRYFNPER
jgi:beta-lactamase class A